MGAPRVSDASRWFYVAYHRDLSRVPRVRLVIDVLVAGLRDALR